MEYFLLLNVNFVCFGILTGQCAINDFKSITLIAGSERAHVLCQNYANCVRRFFVIIAYVRTMQTMSEVWKLCPKDANCVRRLQTMSEGCKLCQNTDFR